MFDSLLDFPLLAFIEPRRFPFCAAPRLVMLAHDQKGRVASVAWPEPRADVSGGIDPTASIPHRPKVTGL